MMLSTPGPMPLWEYRAIVYQRLAEKYGMGASAADCVLTANAEDVRRRWLIGETPTKCAADLIVVAQKGGIAA